LLQEINLPLPAEFVKRFLLENSKEDGEEKLKDLEERFDDYLEIIKWEFIQDKIFEKYDLKIGAEDFKDYIRSFYRDYLKQEHVSDEQVQTELKQLVEDKKRMDSIEESIRRNKSLTLFKSQFNLKEVEYASFSEMIDIEKGEKQAGKVNKTSIKAKETE
jgi:vacuolar-type H+-ATPase catalytic subunit A/Vma1